MWGSGSSSVGAVAERLLRRRAGDGLDQQAAVGVGRVRGGVARPQLQPQPQLVDELLRHEAHEVGVARQAGIEVVERPGTDRGSAHLRESFEHDDVLAGPGQVGGGDEGVVAAADDDDVVVLRHGATLGAVRVRAGND